MVASNRRHLTEPTVFLGFLQTANEIGVDLPQPWQLGWVNPKEWASDTGLIEMILKRAGTFARFRA
jgi:hypothetical protein